MVIASTKKAEKHRIVAAVAEETDHADEATLRPQRLIEYIGQSPIKRHLEVSIGSARKRQAPLEHVLLYGPPGLGKTTLATIIAHEMGSHLKTTAGPTIDKKSDLVSLLSSLERGDVLFIDEIHRLKPTLEEILYSAMEDFRIDILVGTGTAATSIRIDIPPFTLIGATTKPSKLSNPLRDRFGNVLKLEFYTPDDLEAVLRRSFAILGCEVTHTGLYRIIAERSRGTPRIANRYAKILRDYQTVGHPIDTIADIERIFQGLGVDSLGLDDLDRRVLSALWNAGQPVGLSTLAALLGEDEDTIETVIEPYLLKIGLMERTPRGRMVTRAGEEYIAR